MSANTDVKTSGNRDSMRHLNRVGLEVEPLAHALQGEGFTREGLFTVVRERLEQSPVQVLSRTVCAALEGGADSCFLMKLSMSEHETGSYVYAVSFGTRTGRES